MKSISPLVLFGLLSISSIAQQSQNDWLVTMQAQKVFIENKSQFNNRNGILNSEVLFATEDYANQFFFTKQGLTYRLMEMIRPVKAERKARKEELTARINEGEVMNHRDFEIEEKRMKVTADYVHMEWVNANSNVTVKGVDEASHYYNYEELTNVKSFHKIVYENLYPNIDVEYVFHPEQGIVYNFILHPGADASQIRMRYTDVSGIWKDAEGRIHFPTLFGDIIDHAPFTFYGSNRNETIESFFILNGNEVSFHVANYDKNKTVIIDPWTITPAMPSSNRVWEVESDANGNAYIYGGDTPFRLQKYNAAGTLQWTYSTANWDSSNYWVGTLLTDPSGNSYFTTGSNGEIRKISTAGAQLWYNNPNSLTSYEYWNLAFNCDMTKLVCGGSRAQFGLPPIIRGAVMDINLANGALGTVTIVGYGNTLGIPPKIQEVSSFCSAPNGNFYFLTLDTVGSINGTINTINFKVPTTYNFNYYIPGYGFGTKQPIHAIRASRNFFYTHNGITIDRRDLNTGAVLGSAAIPGGISNTTLFGDKLQGNGGLAIDSCGNVYVGAGNQVHKFSENLTLLTSANTTSAVYDVAVSTNGNVLVCGPGYAAQINMTACAIPSYICFTTMSASAAPTNINCNGQCNGSATANAVNASGNLAYNWSNGQTTQTINNLCAGTYAVTITDGANNTATASTTITQPSAISPSANATAATCGSNNGSATVSVTGGTGPFTYIWSNGGSSNTISNLAGGIYTVTVTGAGNCTATASVNVSTTGGLTVSASTVAAGCTATGSATANVTAGTGPFTYAWSNGGNTQTITNVSGGTYTVTVTGAGNCTATASAVVNSTGNGVALSSNSTDATCGNNNGSASVTVTAGSAPFSYLWSNNSTTSTINNIPGGTYTVTVTGQGNCTATASITISTTNGVVLMASQTDATCANSNGTASVTVTSGSAPFSYSWNTGATTSSISSLPGGTYTVTVTGAGNCTATASVTINATGSFLLSVSTSNTTCGNNNGSATVTVTSGGSNYNYVWSNGSTSSSISNLAAGTYTVTVDDGTGCSTTANAIVNPSGGNSAVITSDKVIMCSGDSAMICAPSGFAGYLWNTGQSGQCIYTKLAGNYYVTVTDAGNCTASSNRITINVYPLPPVSITVNGDTLTAYNAVTYQWYFNDAAIPGATSNVHIAQQTGNYTVAVTDTNGCRAVSTKISILTTGMSALLEAGDVNVYPNPLEQGYWNLEVTKGFLGAVVEVFDNNARLVYRGSVLELKSEIDLDVSSGIYMLRITSPKSSFTRKLIKL